LGKICQFLAFSAVTVPTMTQMELCTGLVVHWWNLQSCLWKKFDCCFCILT